MAYPESVDMFVEKLNKADAEKAEWNVKETPVGAQAKADTALNSAKQYTNQKVGEVANELTSHKNDNTRHISSNIPATAITFGGKFQIAYNSASNSLDITVVS